MIAACRCLLLAILVSAFSTGAALAAGAKGTQAGAKLVDDDAFGTSSIRSADLSAFPKWRGAVDRFGAEKKTRPASCRTAASSACLADDWLVFLASVRKMAPREALQRVHQQLNRHPYILDIVNWGIEDYWATPLEFLWRDSGDCEDYSIAKFMALRAIGFDNDKMKVVVLRDLNLRTMHAVLIVELDGRRYVLDNQVDDVIPDSVVRHYMPVYSVNETHWWLHRAG